VSLLYCCLANGFSHKWDTQQLLWAKTPEQAEKDRQEEAQRADDHKKQEEEEEKNKKAQEEKQV
jgi:hypothetical protein